jgi:hypothetical protein
VPSGKTQLGGGNTQQAKGVPGRKEAIPKCLLASLDEKRRRPVVSSVFWLGEVAYPSAAWLLTCVDRVKQQGVAEDRGFGLTFGQPLGPCPVPTLGASRKRTL